MDAPDYNPFPTGSSILVWWPGDKMWYGAKVTDTRIELHKVKGAKVPCHEVYCVYELDYHEQWHSLHNNKIRKYTGVTHSISNNHHIALSKGSNASEPLTSFLTLVSLRGAM